MADSRKTLGVLLNESFSLFTRHIISLAKAAFSVYLPLLLLSFGFVILMGMSTANRTADTLDAATAVQWFVGGIAFALIMVVLSLLYQVVIIKAIAMADKGEDIYLGGLLKDSWDAVNGYLNVVCWVFLRVLLWSLLFIIPGIVFAIFYSYASLAFILDGHKGCQALVSSKEIIRPAIWKFLGNMLAVSIMVLPVYLMISMIVGMIFSAKGGESMSVIPVIGSLLGNMMNVVVGIYPMIFFYFLYQELKRRAATETPVSGPV